VPLMVEMTRRIVEAVGKPVTVKTRLGWDDESKNIEEIALRLQDVGIAALTIHGRTRAQMYRGEADWTLIGKVKNNPRIHIPIIGNGDVDSGPKAAEMFDRYGVDGVMIGRATYGRPWIFREVKHYLATGEVLPQPSASGWRSPRSTCENRWKSKANTWASSKCAATCPTISRGCPISSPHA